MVYLITILTRVRRETGLVTETLLTDTLEGQLKSQKLNGNGCKRKAENIKSSLLFICVLKINLLYLYYNSKPK